MSSATDMRVITPVPISDALFVSSTIAETDHSAWNSGTTYAAGDRVRYVATDVHLVFESLQAANLNKNPTDAANAAWWAEVSPTNRWSMFDNASGTLSTAATEIDVVIAPGRIDSLALFDVDAHTARVRMSTVADGTFVDTTYTMTGTGDLVGDWYDYFYAEIGTRATLIVTELPPISDAQVRVTLTRSGGNVALGNLVVGASTVLGQALYGARPGIIDYSRKETDDFGRTQLVQRAFARRMDLQVVVDRERVDAVIRKLNALRATLSVWLAGNAVNSYEALQVFGWFRDYGVTINGPTYSALSLQIEGIA